MRVRRLLPLLAILTLTAQANAQPAPSRQEMEAYIVRITYQRTCDQARAENPDVARIPREDCIKKLIETRGPALRERMKTAPDASIQKLYQEYRAKPAG